jgi:transposase
MKNITKKNISDKSQNTQISSSFPEVNIDRVSCMTIIDSNGEVVLLENLTTISPELLEMLKMFNEDPTLSKKESKVKSRHKNKLGYIDPTVAGIDIGDKVIHVAFPDGMGGTIVEEFETTTPALYKIAKKLKEKGVSTAVMEATGVYWVPIYDILELRGFQSVLVDAKTVKNVPGRKSDVVDSQWIQTLYSNGLLRAAFRPPRDRLKLRALVRHRMTLVKNKQYALNRIEKALQLMNIKLSTAVSEIGGVSGVNIIRAIAKGEKDPIKLAALRNRNCKKPEQVFIDALTGNFLEENVFVIRQSLAQFDFANDQMKECDMEIRSELETYPTVVNTPIPNRDKDKGKNRKFSTRKKPNRNDISFDVRTLLWQKSGRDFTALGGIEANTALLIFAELGGVDVSCWESVKDFSSWLKLCPGNNISGGKRRKSKKQPCANYISQALRMSAMSAKKSNTALGAHIRRITGRTDKPKGIKAGAHKLAHMLYYMCKDGWVYFEKGADAYEKAYADKCLKNLEKKAKSLGYKLVAV